MKNEFWAPEKSKYVKEKVSRNTTSIDFIQKSRSAVIFMT